VGVSYYRGVISVSPTEIATIALIAFIVFGPKRLPAMARRAGRIIRDLKAAAAEFRSGLEAEADAGPEKDPLGEVRRTLGSTVDARPDDAPRAPDGPAGTP
jgi:sec-independent protein translocase protein TatB